VVKKGISKGVAKLRKSSTGDLNFLEKVARAAVIVSMVLRKLRE